VATYHLLKASLHPVPVATVASELTSTVVRCVILKAVLAVRWVRAGLTCGDLLCFASCAKATVVSGFVAMVTNGTRFVSLRTLRSGVSPRPTTLALWNASVDGGFEDGTEFATDGHLLVDDGPQVATSSGVPKVEEDSALISTVFGAKDTRPCAELEVSSGRILTDTLLHSLDGDRRLPTPVGDVGDTSERP
jgi:hypothetical protein